MAHWEKDTPWPWKREVPRSRYGVEGKVWYGASICVGIRPNKSFRRKSVLQSDAWACLLIGIVRPSQLDEPRREAITEAFIRLFEDGTIYRANRFVNSDVQLRTAVSNLEVESLELKGRTELSVPDYERKIDFGVMTYFQYEVDGSDEQLEIATTRPETLLGDSGVAVNPKDDRYRHLVGKNVRHPFITNRLLPIVADNHVDRELGTGVVKITLHTTTWFQHWKTPQP